MMRSQLELLLGKQLLPDIGHEFGNVPVKELKQFKYFLNRFLLSFAKTSSNNTFRERLKTSL